MLSGKNQKGIDMDANEQKKTPVCAEYQMENPSDAQSNSDHSFAKAVNTGSTPAVRQGLRIAGAVFCILALFLFWHSYNAVHNDQYTFYQKHYAECKAGYEDCLSKARSSSGFFWSSYMNLADSYQIMMDEDMEELNAYRTQAIAYGCGGLVSVGAGLVLMLMKKKR